MAERAALRAALLYARPQKSEVLRAYNENLQSLLASLFVAFDRTMDEPPEPVRKRGPKGREKYKNGRDDEMVVLNFGD